MREPSLGDEIEDIGAPVLHGDVLDLGPLHGHKLHDGAVECGGFEFRRCASLHVGEFGSLIGNDQGALELAEVLGIDPEISLKRVLHLHSRRDIDEAASAEDGAVQR